MKVPKGFSAKTFSMIACWIFVVCHPAASQSFSEGKNLGQLRKAISADRTQRLFLFAPKMKTAPATQATSVVFDSNHCQIPGPAPRLSFLPRWTPECLPFFCRIEHDFAQKNTVPFKFRLGSVEYVDWLEGKHDFPALPPR